MKTTGLLLLGLLVGAAGYWWLYGPATPSTATQIGAAVAEATAQTPAEAPAVSPPTRNEATPPSPAAPTADSGHTEATTPQQAPAPNAPVIADATHETTAGLLLPVQGLTREQLQDTFTDARSEGRVHDAIDIMAPAGTPVLAVADGTVEKFFDSKRGGLTIYQFEPSGRYAYYYAHLQSYAPGLAEKQPLHRGQVIGYVGSTGNANPDAPHLHFAIFRLGPERHWWEGEAINPYPILHDGQAL